MNKEMIIDIKDLCLNVINKWRVSVVCAVIFAIVLNIFGCITINNELQEKANIVDEKQHALKLTKNKLTETECDTVENMVVSYKTMKAQNADLLEYFENSLLMKVDPNNIPCYSVGFSLNSNKTQDVVILGEDKISDSMAMVFSIEDDTAMYEEIIKKTGIANDVVYVREIVQFIPVSYNYFTLRVIGDDKKTCEQIAEIVTNNLNSKVKSLSEIDNTLSLIKFDGSYSNISDYKLAEKQNDILTDYYNVEVRIGTLLNLLTEIEYDYFEAILESEDATEVTTDKEPVAVEKVWFRAKYAISGAAVGLVFGVLITAILYILSRKLRVEADMEKYYNINVLGNIDKNNDDNAYKFIAEKARVICAKKNIAKIAVAGTVQSDAISEIKNHLYEYIVNDSLNVVICGNINKDSDEYKKVIDAGNVILVEKKGKSDYNEISKEIELCKTCNIDIIGSVFVK